MGLAPLHLELWVLWYCPIYSDVSHIYLPDPQGTISYHIHSDYKAIAASSVALSPKQDDFYHPQVPISCHVHGLSLTAHIPPLPVSLLCFNLQPLGGGVLSLPKHTHLHIRQTDYGQHLLFSASSQAPWTVPGISQMPVGCIRWACSRNQLKPVWSVAEVRRNHRSYIHYWQKI